MKTVELVAGIKSSVLGFGCAPVLGSVDKKKSIRALDCALDCGITHFDLARSYGYGEAEGLIGKVLEQKRSDIIIASKFGIQVNWKASLLNMFKPLVRLVRNKKKENIKFNTSSNIANQFHERIPLRSKEMQLSLEKSLRSLRTDYLDYFFIHEPLETITYIEELCETAAKLKKEGKIRAWGLAYMRSAEFLHESYLDKFDILQFDSSVGVNGYEKVVDIRGHEPNIIFSPLKGGKSDLPPSEKLLKLSCDFPKSVLLCSMFNEQHLKNNAALFDIKNYY
jgi:aryl-alcohol dehydrogenase-like predicted oxidoreductase